MGTRSWGLLGLWAFLQAEWPVWRWGCMRVASPALVPLAFMTHKLDTWQSGF
jgi:hypothetical protein